MSSALSAGGSGIEVHVHRYISTLLLCIGTLVPLQAQPVEHRLDFGFEQRVRNENWNNILDFSNATDDERGQVRYRTRVWMKAALTDNIDFAAGLAQETNTIFQPHTAAHIDEGFVETAYLDVRKLFAKGLSLRIGRQNIQKGDNFLFMEGDPWDGSRSVYYNAAVLGYERGVSRIEVIGIFDPRCDRFFPRINAKPRQLIEWNESALGAYYTAAPSKRASYEAYFFYKREFGDPRPASNPQRQADRYVYTSGGRTVQQLPNAFSVTGEFAGQWGRQRPGTPIHAWGGYGYVKRPFGAKKRVTASVGYWAMSGSDPARPGAIGNWDPLFARYPKWSEGYLYSEMKEYGVGYWTNLGMWQAEMVYQPWKKLNLRGTFYQMSAFHPFPGSKSIFASGTNRGQEYQVRADLTLNQHVRGHALYERHSPGSFYTGRDAGEFVRLEVIYTMTGRLPQRRKAS